MARLPSATPYTLWILFFSYTTNEVLTAGHIHEFACFTDYDKELVCHWKVPAQTNCSKEFVLYYSKETSSVLNKCVPENEKDSLRCTCTIYPEYFVLGLTYILALQFNGTDSWNYNVTPALVVKPRAPKNLAIEKAENGNFNLSWEESYSHPSFLSGPVIYEVKYWRKHHPTEVSVKAINYQAKSFEITASSLKRGYDYVASLRCNYVYYPAYWSEWSEEVEFRYDYPVKAEDILQMAVPTSCILIMAGSIICYFCFTKVKKEWWDQIPNPAKSQSVVKNVKFSVLYYFDEMKFPFQDLKQSHMEQQISCKNCLARSLSSQNFKRKDNIRNVEKSCSCHSKSEEWLPKGSSAVLTPDTIPVEECIEICVCLTDSETESQEETGNQITMFEPCESSMGAFREHPEHNELLANMFDALLANENNMQENKGPNIPTSERKTLESIGSENPSQQNPKETTAQSPQPCAISHTAPLFTKASQDDYNCSTASKESELSEESFESGYRSSSINSASLDARDLQQMVHQSHFLCRSESELDSCVLTQESTNKSLFGTKTDRINSPADKSFDTLVSASMGLCSSAYKSCDTLLSPSLEPCGSAYRSFNVLVSACKEPSSSAYKSFSALMSQSMANSSLTLGFESVPSSSPLRQLSEMPECSCRDQSAQPASNQMCYNSYRSPSTELDFPNTCSEHTDFPSFSTHANEGPSAFLSEKEMHKQVIYQNVQRKANIISCSTAPQPSGYQPFGSAGKCNGLYWDSGNEVMSTSLYESFLNLCNNPSEAPSDTAIYESDPRIKDGVCLTVQGSDCPIVPGLASSENDTQTSDGSPWINSTNELYGDSNDGNTSRDEQLLHLLEMKCQDLNSRERATKATKWKSFNSTGKVMQEGGDSRLKY
ncbi:interleukin-4 receptor subunit alpha isoform X1 [Pyrgilauda ruficollis]|uniref:interleukin-4 receptor subunit alpha isoform X1 n=1 Tax=Pyrgilauda ruficollis TaxID=221976 RepID=UPI001B85C8C5|nr:interleukin-4 receptor subunit alpha isoform X1 [Pyrgilauda ruficollis]XP_041346338.1 interleukin-4 receptor subunit alpha isoform X1 [Pyrgilauda ruficollis]XP_041346339.1 interleukin-4 receptor subunit alpha isoform X1 [Pyrgilauda ruficollis]